MEKTSIITEGPRSANLYRADGEQPKNGLVYRMASSLTAGAPIFQVQSKNQAVRFFVEHEGYTGATVNSAWFGGNYTSYFKSGISIGAKPSMVSDYMLTVEGSIRTRKVRAITMLGPIMFLLTIIICCLCQK